MGWPTAACTQTGRTRRRIASITTSDTNLWVSRATTSSIHVRPRPSDKRGVADHHSVYVVYLRDPKGDGRAAYYVGMTGLTPEERFQNHKGGVKAARVVKKFGVRLVPKLYAHLNPMPYRKAVEMEVMLADSLRKRGYEVYGGH